MGIETVAKGQKRSYNKFVRKMLPIGIIIAGVGVGLWLWFYGGTPSKIEVPKEQLKQMEPQAKKLSPPEMTLLPNKKYTVVLKTSLGDITILLNAKETPITVNSFVYLANQHFYNNTIFHRIIKGFMIQGGDQNGDGSGGPGYKFNDEKFTGEYTRGTVAMANAGPNTNGSQFFIMHQDYNLPKNYVIFGKVVSGIEVVDKIADSEVGPSASGEMAKPVTPTKILSAEIKIE